MMNHLKNKAAALWAVTNANSRAVLSAVMVGLPVAWGALTCHRSFYIGLSLAHANGCLVTDYWYLYAPMAALYAGIAWRG